MFKNVREIKFFCEKVDDYVFIVRDFYENDVRVLGERNAKPRPAGPFECSRAFYYDDEDDGEICPFASTDCAFNRFLRS